MDYDGIQELHGIFGSHMNLGEVRRRSLGNKEGRAAEEEEEARPTLCDKPSVAHAVFLGGRKKLRRMQKGEWGKRGHGRRYRQSRRLVLQSFCLQNACAC